MARYTFLWLQRVRENFRGETLRLDPEAMADACREHFGIEPDTDEAADVTEAARLIVRANETGMEPLWRQGAVQLWNPGGAA